MVGFIYLARRIKLLRRKCLMCNRDIPVGRRHKKNIKYCSIYCQRELHDVRKND